MQNERAKFGPPNLRRLETSNAHRALRYVSAGVLAQDHYWAACANPKDKPLSSTLQILYCATISIKPYAREGFN
jgi:hypothetical protein